MEPVLVLLVTGLGLTSGSALPTNWPEWCGTTYCIADECPTDDRTVIISEGTTKIEPEQYKDCTTMMGFMMPTSVTEIGNQAFAGCTGLSSITIPDSVSSFANGV